MLNIPQEKLTAIKNFAHQYIFKLLCQQDIPFILAHLDPQLIGIGAAEHNYYDTPQAAKDFILSLEGQIPACELLNEEWTILPLAQGLYLAQGRHYLTSDEDQQLLVQTHQRATIVIRDLGSDFSYVYINLSHPYQELQGTENFPFQVGSQTYKYMEAELNKAKEQLQQKQQQMEVVLHSVNGGVKSSNDDDTYSYAYISEELPGMFGYTMEEFKKFTGNNAMGMVYPPDLPRALADCNECFKDGNPTYSTKYRVPCKDGSLKWVMDSGRKTKTPEGNTIINSIYLDITKDEEARQSELNHERRTKQQYYDLLSSINSNYYFIYLVNLEDGSGIPLRLPETECAVFTSYSTNGLYDIEPLVRSHFHPDDSAKILEHFSLSGLRRQKKDRHIDFALECRSRLFGSEYRWTAFNSTLLAQSDGYHQIILTLRDIHEDKLKELREQQALQEAFDAAKAANMAKNEFLSRMSHDIRTPMNVITNMAKMVLEEPENKTQVLDYMNKICSMSTFLMGVISDILDVSKMESGKLQLRKEPYSCIELHDAVCAMMEPLCREKNITFYTNLNPQNDIIFTDKTKLNRIFFNLLGNAVKFTPAGGKVSFLHKNIVRTDGFLEWDTVITDTGSGMSKEFQRKMYQPFEQENQLVTDSLAGVGLGLAIVKMNTEAFGGTIAVESEPGKGTAFTIHLKAPYMSGEDYHMHYTASKLQTDLAGKKILLVEDHKLNMEIAKKILEKKQMKVTCAYNGAEAVALFEKMPEYTFDAVIMDIRMPVMNGLEAAAAIRAGAKADAKTIPIIAMSANAFAEDMEKSRRAGMNRHVAKPVEPERLFGVLSESFSD